MSGSRPRQATRGLCPARRAAALSTLTLALLAANGHATPRAQNHQGTAVSHLQVPDGFTIERVAGPDLLSYPMFAIPDPDGRLFVFESTEPNTMTTEAMLAAPTYHIRVLQDTTGDGVYDTSTIYADKLPFPKGGAFHQGRLYVSAAPDLLAFTDTDGDLVADRRERVLSGWTLNVNGAALGGPFLGPDGWLYLTDARRGFRIVRKEGDVLEGQGARIWRLRPDGSGLEWLAGGGFDNAIELAFMPSGDTVGTMTYIVDPQDGVRDALMHWVEGGVYPKPHAVIAADRLPLTGDLLPAMTMLARVSPSGLLRYRGAALGPDVHGNLFSAQFNTGRVMRHIVTAVGSTYRTEDLPFMTSTSGDTHPTDVLQDADGSLLVLDTGGWFIKGCPLSRVEKPQVSGGIFRIRRRGAPVLDDPRGRALAIETMTADQLATHLDDARPVVRDRVLERLVALGEPAVEVLDARRTSSNDEELRADLVFALHRTGTPSARQAVRRALTDGSAVVQTAAARAVGLSHDAAAVEALSALVTSDQLAARRQAATALGQIADVRAVPSLLAAAALPGDRFVEHAVIHALTTMRATAPLVEALDHRSPAVRRAALIALDQMPDSPLRQSQLKPFLDSNDEAIWRTGVWVAAHRPDWSAVVVAALDARLGASTLTAADTGLLRDVMIGACGDTSLQAFVAQRLGGATPIATARHDLLLDVVEACPVTDLPPAWVAALRARLHDTDPAVRAHALRVVAARRVAAVADDLAALASAPATPVAQRLDAFEALVLTRPTLSEAQFAWLAARLDARQQAPVRQQAARILAQASPTEAQLVTIARRHVAGADAFLLPRLVEVFDGSRSAVVGAALVAALASALDRADVLSERDLGAVLGGFPPAVVTSATPLLVAIRQRQAARLTRLTTLEASLGRGDIDAGRRLFFGKATCSSCHAVGRAGGTFAPDLSNIGEIRSRHDILEAVLYPSASFAREYETYRVGTRTGSFTGIIKAQAADSVVLETGPGTSMRIPRSQLRSIAPLEFSTMPPGLEQQLTATELSDLMAYLEALPDPFDRRGKPAPQP